ncbi:hypothetical protein DFJ74DRAFT_763703 [Hyaloraphidium curvatum]|nr:hypothetical protein DFJ74DRAFT_763703 [Hyaloraphidium curvatum]
MSLLPRERICVGCRTRIGRDGRRYVDWRTTNYRFTRDMPHALAYFSVPTCLDDACDEEAQLRRSLFEILLVDSTRAPSTVLAESKIESLLFAYRLKVRGSDDVDEELWYGSMPISGFDADFRRTVFQNTLINERSTSALLASAKISTVAYSVRLYVVGIMDTAIQFPDGTVPITALRGCQGKQKMKNVAVARATSEASKSIDDYVLRDLRLPYMLCDAPATRTVSNAHTLLPRKGLPGFAELDFDGAAERRNFVRGLDHGICESCGTPKVARIIAICSLPDCGTGNKATKRCSRCGTARYCSKECQRADWTKHKESCRQTEPEMGCSHESDE